MMLFCLIVISPYPRGCEHPIQIQQPENGILSERSSIKERLRIFVLTRWLPGISARYAYLKVCGKTGKAALLQATKSSTGPRSVILMRVSMDCTGRGSSCVMTL